METGKPIVNDWDARCEIQMIATKAEEIDITGFPLLINTLEEHTPAGMVISGFTDLDGNPLGYEESELICPEKYKGKKEYFVPLPTAKNGLYSIYVNFKKEDRCI
jgi:hypothetical protein